MAGITPYLQLPGTAREALDFYAEVFGATVEVHTNAEFGADGPADHVAHGLLVDGPVQLYAADGEPGFRSEGLMFALRAAPTPRPLLVGSRLSPMAAP